jgi:hypothetical protein
MPLQETIRKATCRVDSEGEQLGSSFWVNENMLLTAAHVTEAAQQNSIAVRTVEGELLDAQVVRQDVNTDSNPGSDMALLETNEMPNLYETLPLNTNIPSIGTELVWSGYARLFGESKIDRQRFGWGRVASKEYGENDGTFFEVDGLFNPSHSGGPVVVSETGQVVGLVSASAGGFERLEQEWTNRIEMLQELFSLQQGPSGMLFRTFTYEEPENALRDKALFERLGLSVDTDTDDDGNMQVQINTEEIPIAAGQIQAELGKLLLDTTQATFQMGVGIATGGEALEEFL